MSKFQTVSVLGTLEDQGQVPYAQMVYLTEGIEKVGATADSDAVNDLIENSAGDVWLPRKISEIWWYFKPL